MNLNLAHTNPLTRIGIYGMKKNLCDLVLSTNCNPIYHPINNSMEVIPDGIHTRGSLVPIVRMLFEASRLLRDHI